MAERSGVLELCSPKLRCVQSPSVATRLPVQPESNPSSLLSFFLQRFDELLQLASKGQHTSVDMLVKDIYGGSYGSLGLTGDLIASSFGKSATADKGDAHTSTLVSVVSDSCSSTLSKVLVCVGSDLIVEMWFIFSFV